MTWSLCLPILKRNPCLLVERVAKKRRKKGCERTEVEEEGWGCERRGGKEGGLLKV